MPANADHELDFMWMLNSRQAVRIAELQQALGVARQQLQQPVDYVAEQLAAYYARVQRDRAHPWMLDAEYAFAGRARQLHDFEAACRVKWFSEVEP
jgi:hypothetical protein